jgi:hypothetical protein
MRASARAASQENAKGKAVVPGGRCDPPGTSLYFAGAGVAGAGLGGCVTGDLMLNSARPPGPEKVPWAFMKKIATTATRSAPTKKASQGVALLFSPLSLLTL